MEIGKSKVLIQFLLIFRRSGDVLFFLYARRLCGYAATVSLGNLVHYAVTGGSLRHKHGFNFGITNFFEEFLKFLFSTFFLELVF